MTGPNVTAHEHLLNERLIQLLDDELTGEETTSVKAHLAGCAICRDRFSELRQVSGRFDSFVSNLYPAYSLSDRQQLAQKLDSVESKTQKKVQTRSSWRQLGWGMALAATLALGVLAFPRWKPWAHLTSTATPLAQTASSAFEVDGEIFVALPYSNPDLPLTSPRIVQMQVPVSSLADAGIYLEPVGSRVSGPDRAVLADVLLGLDGQPLGVHVLTSD